MKAAILGTGSAADNHAWALKALGVDVVAGVNHHLPKAEAFCKRWSIPLATDEEDRLSQEDIDVVHICTPANLHYPSVKKFLERGKHVLCEKPLVLSSAEAEDLLETARMSGAHCGVNYNVRYFDGIQEAKKIIREGSAGEIFLIRGSYCQEFHMLPAPFDWRYKPDSAGKMRAVTEIGTHWIDLVTYLAEKEICRVSGIFHSLHPYRRMEEGQMVKGEETDKDAFKIDSEDCALISMEFTDGTMGNVVLSEVSPGKSNALEVELTGAKKTLYWNSEQSNHLHVGERGKGMTDRVFAFGGGFKETYLALMEDFYNGLKGKKGEKHYPTLKESYTLTKVLEAVYKSARRKGEWFHV